VRIISPKRIRQAVDGIKDAELENDLEGWMQVAKAGQWRSFEELRQSFTSADKVDDMVVFDIRHNRYRLITRIVYSRWFQPDGKWTQGQVLVGAVYRHQEYDRWNRLNATEKKERIWPRYSQTPRT
jgi:mRNA interferase HigB